MTTPVAQREVSPESTGKAASFSRREPVKRETGLSLHYRERYGTESAKALPRKAV